MPDSITPAGTSLKPTGLFHDDALPVSGFTPDENARACRHIGSGMAWDCAATSYTANTISRSGVTQLSEWAASKREIAMIYLPLVSR
jgi:hypothetical protein